MREANMTESKSTIGELQSVNEEMKSELARLKGELEGYKERERESASRYESISRTLLAARENADALTQKTNEECEAKTAAVRNRRKQYTLSVRVLRERLRKRLTDLHRKQKQSAVSSLVRLRKDVIT